MYVHVRKMDGTDGIELKYQIYYKHLVGFFKSKFRCPTVGVAVGMDTSYL
jgi:hypothetical protein